MKLNWLTKGSDDQNLGGKSESFGTWVQATSKPITWSFCPLNAYQTDSPIEYIGTFVETNNIRLLISYMQRIWMWYGCIIGPRIELQHRRDDFKSLDEAFWIDTWICLYDIKIKWIKIFKIEPRHRCYEMNLYPNMFFFVLDWTSIRSTWPFDLSRWGDLPSQISVTSKHPSCGFDGSFLLEALFVGRRFQNTWRSGGECRESRWLIGMIGLDRTDVPVFGSVYTAVETELLNNVTVTQRHEKCGGEQLTGHGKVLLLVWIVSVFHQEISSPSLMCDWQALPAEVEHIVPARTPKIWSENVSSWAWAKELQHQDFLFFLAKTVEMGCSETASCPNKHWQATACYKHENLESFLFSPELHDLDWPGR